MNDELMIKAEEMMLCTNGHYPDVGVPGQYFRGDCEICGVPLTCDLPGLVPRYPELRKDCYRCQGHKVEEVSDAEWIASGQALTNRLCSICNGRGWIL